MLCDQLDLIEELQGFLGLVGRVEILSSVCRLDLTNLPANRCGLIPLLAKLTTDDLVLIVILRATQVRPEQFNFLFQGVQSILQDLQLMLNNLGSVVRRGGGDPDELLPQRLPATTLQDTLAKDTQHKLQCRLGIDLIVVTLPPVGVDVTPAGVKTSVARGLRVHRIAAVHVIHTRTERISSGIFGLRNPTLMLAAFVQYRLGGSEIVRVNRRSEARQGTANDEIFRVANHLWFVILLIVIFQQSRTIFTQAAMMALGLHAVAEHSHDRGVA